MSESTGEVRVRNVRTKRNDSFVETALGFGGGVLRFGLTVVTLPINLLPPQSRQHIRNATKEFGYAFASLPAEFAVAANKVYDQVSVIGEAFEKGAPKDELSSR